MFYWHPIRDELNQWVGSKEKEFSEQENKSPRLSTEDWLQKHIFTDLHTIFFAISLKMTFEDAQIRVIAPLDPRKTRSQFHTASFASELYLDEKLFMMVGYDLK